MLILRFEILDHFFILTQKFSPEIGHVFFHFGLPVMLSFKGLGFKHVDKAIFFLDLIFKLIRLLTIDLLLTVHDFEGGLKRNEFTGELLYFSIFFVDKFGLFLFLILELSLHEVRALVVNGFFHLCNILGHLALETDVFLFPHLFLFEKLFVNDDSSTAVATTFFCLLVCVAHQVC